MEKEKKSMKIEDIRELCKEAHENAVRHGFWDEEHDIRHYLMLVITELAEAVQAYRKNRFADRNEYEKLVKERGCAEDTAFLLSVKDTFEDEMADTCIRLMDLAGASIGECEFRDTVRFVKGFNAHKEITEVIWNAIHFIDTNCYVEHDILACYLIRLSEAIGIDIEWHIRQKMAYNASRPYLHGNKF